MSETIITVDAEALAISNLIGGLVQKIDDLKLKKKVILGNLETAYEDDPQWKKHKDDLRLAKDAKKYRELEINQDKNLGEFIEKKDEINEELKECKIALSDYLGSYHQKTGATICDISGRMITIVAKYTFKSKQLNMFGEH